MGEPANMAHERRSEPRVPTQAPARLLHGDGLTLWADCTIKDLSANGAKVELSHFYKIPPRFVLIHLHDGVAYEALIKWRRGDLAGMAFEARHDLTQDVHARLEPAQVAWRALMPGFRRPEA